MCRRLLCAVLGAGIIIMMVMIMMANTCWELMCAQHFTCSQHSAWGRYYDFLYFRNGKRKYGRLSEWAQFTLLVNGNDAGQSGSQGSLIIVFYDLLLCHQWQMNKWMWDTEKPRSEWKKKKWRKKWVPYPLLALSPCILIHTYAHIYLKCIQRQ